jgi:hypothetical protein
MLQAGRCVGHALVQCRLRPAAAACNPWPDTAAEQPPSERALGTLIRAAPREPRTSPAELCRRKRAVKSASAGAIVARSNVATHAGALSTSPGATGATSALPSALSRSSSRTCAALGLGNLALLAPCLP